VKSLYDSRLWNAAVGAVVLMCLSAVTALAQKVAVEEHVLDNGMRVLLLPRKGSSTVAVGWVARVGSVNEHPGITGISHLFEHMMFKGTNTIGTKDAEEDTKLNLEQDRVKAELRKEDQELIRRYRLGEIDNPKDPKYRSEHHKQLLAEFDKLIKRQSELVIKNDYDRIYKAQGAAGINAGTSEDFTIYFLSIPTNKLELWFWMESDRLNNPVFREFYAERDVVHEERRMRTDSTPTGLVSEQFNSMFWQSSPYGWPVVGWPSDLESITREEANAYFSTYYAPNNLSACLVGDFEPKVALEFANKYFGRLQRGRTQPEPVRTVEVPQHGEQRMIGYADTTPEVRIRFHTVADGHKDEPALRVLSSLLNDRTGRLYKSLVLQQQIATSAFAAHDGNIYDGYMELRGVARQGKTPEEVEKAIDKELEKLQTEPVTDHELQKTKNMIAASEVRRLQSDFSLMMQILVQDANRGWKTLNTDPALLQAVTADDVQRVAKKYLVRDNRNVLVIYRKPGAQAAVAGGAQ
jgi:predicted Zn-dependent peptidase